MAEAVPNRDFFQGEISRFHYSLGSIRDFLKYFSRHLKREHDHLLKRSKLALGPEMMLRSKRLLGDEGLPAETVNELRDALIATQQALGEMGISVDILSEKPTFVYQDPRVEEAVRNAESQHRDNHMRWRRVREMALISIVAQAEFLAAALMSRLFVLQPELLQDAAYKLTLADLSTFEDILQARQYIVDRRIAEETQRAPNEWISFLRTKFHVSEKPLKDYKDQIKEIGLRRNLLVHNNGKINSFYIRSAPQKYRADGDIGQQIGVSFSYVLESLDALEIVMGLLGGQAWIKSENEDDKEAGRVFVNLSYQSLIDERWEVAREYAAFVGRLKHPRDIHRWMALFNEWQALKWSGEWNDKLAKRVEDFDTDALEPPFKLARFALLEKKEEFFEQFERAVANGTIEPWHARHWPIFREMRRDERFSKIVKEKGWTMEARIPGDDETLKRLMLVVENDITDKNLTEDGEDEVADQE